MGVAPTPVTAAGLSLPRRMREVVQPFLSDSLRGRLARATFWSLAASVAGQAGALLSSILCARILGAAAFGKLGIVRGTVLLFGAFGGGLGIAASRYVAEYRATDRERAGRMIGLLLAVAAASSSLLMLIVIALAGPIAASLSSADLIVPIRIAALLLVTNTFVAVQGGVLAGFERFRAVAWVSAADGLLNVVLPTFGAWRWGIDGAVAGLAAAGIAGLTVKQIVIHRVKAGAHIRMHLRGARRELGMLWTIAVPAMLVGVALQPFDWVSRLLLVRRGGSFAELGVFTAAFSLAQFVTFLPMQISGPVMPILANLLGAGDGRRARKLVLSSQLLVVAVAAVSGAALLVFAGPALAVFGRGFTGGRTVLVLLTLAYVVASPTLVSRAIFTATDRLWWQTWQTVVWGALLTMATFFLARRGAEGFALAYLIAYTVFTFLQLAAQRGAVAAADKGPPP